MTVRVKICGLTRPQDAAAAVAAGADLVGFIFVPGTPRALMPEDSTWIRSITGAATVGVFRDAPLAEVLRVRELLDLDWVQLHGDEPDDWLGALGPRVLRRVAVGDSVDWGRVAALADACLPLLDPGAGSGVAVPLERFARPWRDLRFGVAGGLTPENVGRVIQTLRPALVDVASGVESAPGVKDPRRVAAFVAAARAAASEGVR